MSGFEVVVPTRGNIEAVCVGLLSQAAHKPFPINFVTARLPETPRERCAVEMLRGLGCDIRFSLQRREGGAAAWAQGIEELSMDVGVFLDDDAALIPKSALNDLAFSSHGSPWVAPVIRFAANLSNPPEDHTELWGNVRHDNPAVQRALSRYGDGWIRVFEIGEDVFSDQLGGTCFAATRERLQASGAVETLMRWPKYVGGRDYYLGAKLGVGRILSGIYAYHWGTYTPEKWGMAEMGRRMLYSTPELYATEARLEGHGTL